ncbi:YfcL family protein [Aestuariibacter salexigens]|uniref:YfcL family protein n=1 Tax=Aestuariibacter salexigens TaxID=226010 RepID=UPI0003F6080C|nr:YfcL family protein [Aestuariibacter salexigens]
MNHPTETLAQCVERIEQQLFDMVDTASEHDLFISGYLHGHFSLIVSQAERQNETTLSALNSRMQQSLDDAFSNNELNESDQEDVRNLWRKLFENKSV